jgi:hypothetical protein
MKRTLSGQAKFFWLGLVFLLYGLQTLPQLNLPGLHYDEAVEVLPAMQIIEGQPVTSFRANGLLLGGVKFPLMTQDYIGAINTYASIPFLLLFGHTTAAIRVYSLVIGLLTILLTYCLAAELFDNPATGLLAAALLAVMPSFVFWSRQGVFVTSVTAAIGLGAAWAWLRWWRTSTFKYALLGAFLFGLGVYAKLLFLWVIAAFFVSSVILNSNRWLSFFKGDAKMGRSLILKRLPALAAAAGLGMWPLLAYNLQNAGTFSSIFQNLHTSFYGTNNLALIPNTAFRFKQFGEVLSSAQLWYLGAYLSNKWALIVFALGIIGTFYISSRHEEPLPNRYLLPFSIVLLIILESIFTVSALFHTHFYILLAYPAIATAGAVELFWKKAKWPPLPPQRLPGFLNRLSKSSEFCLLLLLLGSHFVLELNLTRQYQQSLTQSGGLSDHSDAIYHLADWLVAHPPAETIAMDWGVSAQIAYLSGGRINPIETFGYDWKTTGEFNQRLIPYIKRQGAVFLWRSPDEIVFDRSADFKNLYRPLNLEEDILEAFYERSGRPLYGITKLVPNGTAVNPPK